MIDQRRWWVDAHLMTWLCAILICAGVSELGLRGQSAQVALNASAIFYRVSPPVRARVQPKGNSCWATVATMLLQWQADRAKSGLTFQEKDTVHWADDHLRTQSSATVEFEKALDEDRGLRDDEKEPFIQGLGLEFEYPAEYTVDGWLSLIKEFGPLWATAVTKKGFSVHAYLITGIDGDGTYEKTFLVFVDPLSGKECRESLFDFASRYERTAINDMNDSNGSGGADDSDLRIQIVHWPREAAPGFPKK